LVLLTGSALRPKRNIKTVDVAVDVGFALVKTTNWQRRSGLKQVSCCFRMKREHHLCGSTTSGGRAAANQAPNIHPEFDYALVETTDAARPLLLLAAERAAACLGIVAIAVGTVSNARACFRTAIAWCIRFGDRCLEPHLFGIWSMSQLSYQLCLPMVADDL
jgi:hypothetical protein